VGEHAKSLPRGERFVSDPDPTCGAEHAFSSWVGCCCPRTRIDVMERQSVRLIIKARAQIIHEAILELYGSGDARRPGHNLRPPEQAGELTRVGGPSYLQRSSPDVHTAAKTPAVLRRIVRERAILQDDLSKSHAGIVQPATPGR